MKRPPMQMMPRSTAIALALATARAGSPPLTTAMLAATAIAGDEVAIEARHRRQVGKRGVGERFGNDERGQRQAGDRVEAKAPAAIPAQPFGDTFHLTSQSDRDGDEHHAKAGDGQPR